MNWLVGGKIRPHSVCRRQAPQKGLAVFDLITQGKGGIWLHRFVKRTAGQTESLRWPALGRAWGPDPGLPESPRVPARPSTRGRLSIYEKNPPPPPGFTLLQRKKN
ncbi:uncharacterized protein LOC117080276 isoform X2 [Trachypithecus francoisi]|uniref:uncharacterized protein LOC117080276 isoform X2 n=1 Tax=Trachypithecus francoisi TaxID=54180 RepID=UPI00141A900D|nr:uncharacterized protein LOC117080276 isoform X2 [Trachypithecus francoisi]